MERDRKIPIKVLEAIGRAYKETMQANSCVPSTVAFTHHSNDETWMSGLRLMAITPETLEGAKVVAEMYHETVNIEKFDLLKTSEGIDVFLREHTKIWVSLDEFPGSKHMLGMIRNQSEGNDSFFVWDTNVTDLRFFSRKSANEVVAMIRGRHHPLYNLYLVGFNPKQR